MLAFLPTTIFFCRSWDLPLRIVVHEVVFIPVLLYYSLVSLWVRHRISSLRWIRENDDSQKLCISSALVAVPGRSFLVDTSMRSSNVERALKIEILPVARVRLLPPSLRDDIIGGKISGDGKLDAGAGVFP